MSGDEPKRPHVEPFLAANPKDPQHLIAASIAYLRRDGKQTCTAFTSFDGGQTWTRRELPDLKDQFFISIDPWLAFGPAGTAYYSCLSSHIFVYRSTDGGRSWLGPAKAPDGDGSSYDQPKIAVDHTAGKFSGTVYISSSQGIKLPPVKGVFRTSILRSTDGGRTFSNPVQILPNNFNNQNGNQVVLSDGTLVASFIELTINNKYLKHPRLWVVKSSDGGQTFSTPYLVAELEGRSSFPRVAVDQSTGAYRDRLYMVQEIPVGGYSNILLWYSADKGSTWSEAVRVNDNQENKVAQRMPAVTVDKDGIVGVIWHDRRNWTVDQRRKDPGNECSEIFFSASLDGGKTFLPNVRVSTQSCPGVPGNSIPSFGPGSQAISERFPTGGDYIGLTATSDGVFHALWADSRTGVYQLWTTSIRVNANQTQRVLR